jgi:hypothetical protein
MSDRIGLARCRFRRLSHLLIRADPIDATSIWREAMNPFVYRLSVIHRRLEDEIGRELKKRFPDDFRLLRLKKLKLAVKDRLHVHMRRERRVSA